MFLKEGDRSNRMMRSGKKGSSAPSVLQISMICHRRIEVIGGAVHHPSDLEPGVIRSGRHWIVSGIEVICQKCFSDCKSLASVTFESGSRLSRLEKSAFSQSGLHSIHFPASIEVICESCFSNCKSLESVTFESGSRLSRLEKKAFSSSGLRSIHFPASIEVICESCFDDCIALTSVSFDPSSGLYAPLSVLLSGSRVSRSSSKVNADKSEEKRTKE
jgi:hypothetical protein